MKVLSVVSGFITNSSSVINGFSREVFEDQRVQTLLAKYDVRQGFLGEYLCSRSSCGSLILTPEQKVEANSQLNDPESSQGVSFNENDVYVMYGDEYSGLAQEINALMQEVAQEKKVGWTSYDYH